MLLKSVRSFGQLIGLLLPIESLSRDCLSEIGLPPQEDPLGLTPIPLDETYIWTLIVVHHLYFHDNELSFIA